MGTNRPKKRDEFPPGSCQDIRTGQKTAMLVARPIIHWSVRFSPVQFGRGDVQG